MRSLDRFYAKSVDWPKIIGLLDTFFAFYVESTKKVGSTRHFGLIYRVLFNRKLKRMVRVAVAIVSSLDKSNMISIIN